MDRAQNREVNFLPLVLWLCCFPFGVAMQQAVFALALVLLFFYGFKAKRFKAPLFMSPPFITSAEQTPLVRSQQLFVPCFLSGLYVLWLIVATLLNPQQSIASIGSHPFGYLAWIIAPSLFAYFYGGLKPGQWQLAARIVVTLSCLWALVAISQWLWGWRILGATFVFEEQFRPKGFYSHPLSFAYAALLLWPCAIQWTLRRLKSPWAWALLLSVAVCLILTQSRTVQVIALFLALINMFREVKKTRNKLALLLILALGLGAVLSSPGGVASKYRETFSTEGHDRFSPYPDDRLAFWHAHYLMVKERPILGHGIDIDTKYRFPYYERLGLGSFRKQYAAHNMFLQILTNGGLIGLCLFVLWFSWYARLLAKLRRVDPFVWQVGWQTFAGFFIAALTQNAFQDASVRMVFSLFCTALCVAAVGAGLINSEK